VPSFGDPDARLLIVGLAPAAHGANRTGRMFTGDSSGEWLYEALHRSGFASHPVSRHREDELTLTGAWITAAAHCAPPDNMPNREELEACQPYLEREIELLVGVRVTLVLGRVAWKAWLRAAGWWTRLTRAERPRFAHGAEAALPDGRTLLCSYHPSRQNTNTGRLTRPMWHAVFDRARTLADVAPRPT
jgi:uracil-DNA glycosylase family 4